MSPASRRRAGRLALVSGLLSLAAALVVGALRDNLTFFYTPSQVHEQGLQPGRAFRMGGRVEAGSLNQRPGTLAVHFVVADGQRRVPVVYEGLLPDLFGENKGVVASGRLDRQGVFRADQILAKHDETYQPPTPQAGRSSRPDWLASTP